jgi:hypothetical protein
MVEIATAFIGFNREGSNSFAAQDIVAISGTMPGEASLIQMKAEFEQKYLPLLEEAIAAKSTFVLENRSGINKLAIRQLKDNGYIFKQSNLGFISAIQPEKSKSCGTNSQSLPAFVIPRVESSSDRQLKLSGQFLPTAVQLLRMGNSKSFENSSYSLNLSRPDLTLTLKDKTTETIVYKTSYDPKKAA